LPPQAWIIIMEVTGVAEREAWVICTHKHIHCQQQRQLKWAFSPRGEDGLQCLSFSLNRRHSLVTKPLQDIVKTPRNQNIQCKWSTDVFLIPRQICFSCLVSFWQCVTGVKSEFKCLAVRVFRHVRSNNCSYPEYKQN
jgi:hypothetical protein